MAEEHSPKAEAWAALTPALWSGILIGASFLATTAKFQAPSLDLPVALDVGRQTFQWIAWTEWALVSLYALLIGFSKIKEQTRALATRFLIPVAALVFAQAVWMRPVLDARVQVIMDGGMPPASHLHTIFAGAEFVKALLLVVLAFRLLHIALKD
jgi:hypothetical protein